MTSASPPSIATCPTVPLSNGLQIPILGLGTSHQGGYSQQAVLFALRECGVRHIDTARRYGCEEQLGVAVRESGVPRGNLWLTSKLWPLDYGYQSAKQACRDSCARLGVEYLDLYLMHWPDCMVAGRSNREVRAETWRALEELYNEGVCRAIGVSNFLVHHLEELKEDGSIRPHVNQVEFHPFQQPWELVQYCQKEGIVFEGYCPLAKGQALTHPKILRLAKKYSCTPAQICIRWSIQNGIVTIPKSTKEERIRENSQNGSGMERRSYGLQLEVPGFSSSVVSHHNQHHIMVNVRGQSFRAHKVVLAATSPYFRDHVSLNEMSTVFICVHHWP